MRVCSALALLLVSTTLHAEYFGLPNGRLATLDSREAIAVDAGFVTGSFGELDYSHKGLRVNYRISPTTVVFGDLGQSQVANPDDVTLGIGSFFLLPGVSKSMDVAFKASWHRADFGSRTTRVTSSGGTEIFCNFTTYYVYGGCGVLATPGSTQRTTARAAITLLSSELLFSGRQPLDAAGRLRWYANTGIHSVRGGPGGDTELGIGAGIVTAMNSGEVFAGADHVDELTFGIGYRFFMQ